MKPEFRASGPARPLRRRLHASVSTLGVIAALAAAAAWPGTAAGRESAVVLDDITVIGTRSEVSVLENPRSVSVIGQEQLQRQAPLSIGEALRDVPGVELVDDGVAGMKRLRIRGESSRRVTVLVDGQEITDHSSYGTPILINPASVERIDVVRGPTSVLWGAKAIGGVINIITKKGAPGKAVEVELGGGYYSGTNGRQGWANVSGAIENMDYRLTGGIADHDDQKTPSGQYTSTGELENSGFENDDISAHLGFTLGEQGNHYFAIKAEQYRLESEFWTDPAEITGSLPFTDGVTEFTIGLPKRDRRKVGVYYDGKDLGGAVSKLHFDAYHQTIDRLFENSVGELELPYLVSVDAASDDTITNYGATAQIDLELLPRHYTIFGVQYLADILETDKNSQVALEAQFPGPPNINTDSESTTKARIDTLSFFAQDTWEFVDNVKLIGGVRLNRIQNKLEKNEGATSVDFPFPSTSPTALVTPGSSTDIEVSTSLGLTYTGIEDTTLRALYSSGYINPTLLQLYGFTSAGGQSVYGNPDLKLEKANNFEIGYRYDDNQLVIDATGYYTKSKDYITFVDCGAGSPSCPNPAGSSGPNGVFVNVDEAKTYGAELLVQYTVPGTTLTPYASGALTRRQITYAEFSTYDTNAPLASGRFGLRYEWDMAGVAAWADLFGRAGSSVKETVPGDAGPETSEVGSWATLNLAFGGTYGPEDNYRLGVQFNNITDVEYRPVTDVLPGVGRSVDVTAAVKF